MVKKIIPTDKKRRSFRRLKNKFTYKIEEIDNINNA